MGWRIQLKQLGMIMSNKHFFISILFSIFAVVGCNESPVYFHGYIDDEFIDFLEQNVEDGATLVLSSNGGKSGLGLLTADVIHKKKIHVVMDGKYGFCLSGCAEYVLPSAFSLQFIDDPIIGYHQNPQIIHSILKDNATKDMEYCGLLNSHVRGGERVLERGNLKVDFWKETYKRLDLMHSELYYFDKGCPGLKKTFRNEIWLPTSEQLKNLIGYNVTGSVCADNFSECSKRADTLWKKGTSIVIGDTVHVSTGATLN